MVRENYLNKLDNVFKELKEKAITELNKVMDVMEEKKEKEGEAKLWWPIKGGFYFYPAPRDRISRSFAERGEYPSVDEVMGKRFDMYEDSCRAAAAWERKEKVFQNFLIKCSEELDNGYQFEKNGDNYYLYLSSEYGVSIGTSDNYNRLGCIYFSSYEKASEVKKLANHYLDKGWVEV